MPNPKRHKYRDWYDNPEREVTGSKQEEGGVSVQGYNPPPFRPDKHDPFLLPLLLVLATFWSCIFVKVGIIDQNMVAFLALPHIIIWWGFVVWEYFDLDNKDNKENGSWSSNEDDEK